MTSAIDALLSPLRPIGLADLGTASLMSRVDERFVLPTSLLSRFLEQCGAAYAALVVDGRRRHRYRTTYFDTADLAFYHAHLVGRATRRKLRVRTYVDSSERFLEIKCRDNHDRTTKARVPVTVDGVPALAHLGALPPALVAGLGRDMLHAVVVSGFTRITLVAPDRAERLTIDEGLTFETAEASAAFSQVVYVEVKQARRAPSPALAALRRMGCRPGALSKYSLGVASAIPGVRVNRFKPLLHQLHCTERDDLLHAVRG